MKKTLLIVTEFMPYPLNSGGNIAQFEMNDVIRKKFQLIMVFPVYKGQETDLETLKKLWDDVTFYPIFNNLSDKLNNFRYNLMLRKPYSFFANIQKKYIFSKAVFTDVERFVLDNSKIFHSSSVVVENKYLSKINEVLEKTNIDIIQIEFHNLLTTVSSLPKNIKKIYVNHEIRYIREKRELALLTKINPYLNYLYIKNKGFEISFMNEYDKVVTVSDDDCKELEHYISKGKVCSSPLTIKYKNLSLKNSYKSINNIIFLGGEEHFPNKDGVMWFLDNCWSKLLDYKRDLNFTIVGNWSLKTQKTITEIPNIIFKGFVQDLGEVLKDSIFIVPIRIGSGMRMKIIDAVNFELPFVTTTVGVEGLNFKNNIDCLIGDTPDEFISKITSILEDEELATSLTLNAKKTLLSEYSYDSLIKRRVEIYGN